MPQLPAILPADSTTATPIREFADSQLLQERLTSAFHSAPRKHILVALICGDHMSFAALGNAGDPTDAVVRAGCISKLFVSALIQDAARTGKLELHADIGVTMQRLGIACPARFAEISLKQLLEHTHGLDDSMLVTAPKRTDGYIDAPRLCAELDAQHRLTHPGERYSYSNAGAWLAASLLEQLHAEPYPLLLQRQLFPRSSVPGNDMAGACAARGNRLTIRLAELAEFLQRHFVGHGVATFDAPADTVAREVVPLSGWNAAERGVRLGWKSMGHGWFGHGSVLPEFPLFVRIQPHERVALLVASTTHAPTIVAAGVFGRALPELSALRVPTALPAHEASTLDTHRYTGVFRNAAQSIAVTRVRAHELVMQVQTEFDPLLPSWTLEAKLRPARHDIFLTQPLQRRFPYLQVLFDERQTAAYLWNGQRLWKRQWE